jgi:hypothetical protein
VFQPQTAQRIAQHDFLRIHALRRARFPPVGVAIAGRVEPVLG